MKELKIKVLDAKIIAFSPLFVSFLRNEQNTKEAYLNYSNASGQVVNAGQVLYIRGTLGQPDYLEVKSIGTYTLINSGAIGLSITAYPGITKPDESVYITVAGKSATLNLNYESAPTINPISIEIENRTTKVFSASDFNSQYSSYDGTPLGAVMLVGDLSGFTYNNVPLVADTWVSVQDLSNSKLKYVSLDQDSLYEKSVQYKVKDINNLSSN